MTLTLHPAGDSFGTELAGCWLLSSALPFRRHHWSHRLQVWSVCVWEPARATPVAIGQCRPRHRPRRGARRCCSAPPDDFRGCSIRFLAVAFGFLEFGPSGSPGPTQATRAGFHHPFPCAWGNSLLYVLHVPRLQSSTVTALSGSRAQQPLSDGAGRNRKQRGAGPVGHGSAIVLVS